MDISLLSLAVYFYVSELVFKAKAIPDLQDLVGSHWVENGAHFAHCSEDEHF